MEAWMDIGPDIEVEADEWEEQQAVLRSLAEEEAPKRDEAYCGRCDRVVGPEDIMSGGNCRRCGEPLDFYPDGINSCDALRILDGVA